MDVIYDWIIQNYSNYTWLFWVYFAFAVLGSIVDLGEKIIMLTPTKSDDKVVEWINGNAVASVIRSFLRKFSLLKHVSVK